MAIETLIEDDRWTAAGLEPLADRATDAALAHLGLDPVRFEIALLACDDARIAALNTAFRDKPQPTNVLSWPTEYRAAEAPGEDPPPPAVDALGDIAIAYETCAREAAEQGKPLADHITHLLVHATLHLLGYDHIRPADAALMERFEVEILATLGVPDPY